MLVRVVLTATVGLRVVVSKIVLLGSVFGIGPLVVPAVLIVPSDDALFGAAVFWGVVL